MYPQRKKVNASNVLPMLRLLIKSAVTLKLAKEDAADASADQERCYAKPMLLLMTRNAARDSR